MCCNGILLGSIKVERVTQDDVKMLRLDKNRIRYPFHHSQAVFTSLQDITCPNVLGLRNRSRRRRRSRGMFLFLFANDITSIFPLYPLHISNPILFSSTSSIGRRSFSTTDMALLSEKPVTTTTTSDDVDEYQYVMIEEKPPQEDANDRAIDDEEELPPEDSGDVGDYDSWDEDEDEDDSSDSPDTEEW